MDQWIEVMKEQIPIGHYTLYFTYGESASIVYLLDEVQEILVEIKFGGILAVQELNRRKFTKGLNPSIQFVESDFRNIIYRIIHGKFYEEVNESCSGLLEFYEAEHYIIVCEDSVFEFIVWDLQYIRCFRNA